MSSCKTILGVTTNPLSTYENLKTVKNIRYKIYIFWKLRYFPVYDYGYSYAYGYDYVWVWFSQFLIQKNVVSEPWKDFSMVLSFLNIFKRNFFLHFFENSLENNYFLRKIHAWYCPLIVVLKLKNICVI